MAEEYKPSVCLSAIIDAVNRMSAKIGRRGIIWLPIERRVPSLYWEPDGVVSAFIAHHSDVTLLSGHIRIDEIIHIDNGAQR